MLEYEASDNASFKRGILNGKVRIKVTDPSLAKKVVNVLKIRVWAFAIAIVLVSAGIATAIVMVAFPPAAPIAGSTLLPIAAPAIGLVGLAPAIAMVALGIILGGTTQLKKLYYGYKVAKKGKDWVIIEKK